MGWQGQDIDPLDYVPDAGEPDWTPEYDAEPECPHSYSDPTDVMDWMCTRTKGHRADHAAGDGDRIAFVWPIGDPRSTDAVRPAEATESVLAEKDPNRLYKAGDDDDSASRKGSALSWCLDLGRVTLVGHYMEGAPLACTRLKGHGGNHAAGDGTTILGVWG